MRTVMKMIVESDDARGVTEREILRIERGAHTAIEQRGLGLTLLEAKAALAARFGSHRGLTQPAARVGTACEYDSAD